LYWQTRSHAERGESFQNQDFVGGMQNGRRFAPTIFLVLKPFLKNCGIHCTKFECILKAIPTTNEPPRHPPRRASAETPKENTPCISDLAGVKFLLKKERVFFFRGFFPPSIRAGGGANADSDGTAGGGWGEECRAVLVLILFFGGG